MDPLTLTYLALMAASTGASAMAQRKTNKERSKVFAEERRLRKEHDRANQASAQNTLDQVTRTKQREDARAGELAEMYRAAPRAEPTTTAAGTRFLDSAAPIGTTETVENIKRSRAEADAESNAKTARFAKLGAFGDVNAANALLSARNQQDIGLQSGLFQGWQSNVLPAILDKANQSGRDWATAADIMKLAATVMSLPALAKTGAGQAAGTGTEAADIAAARYGDFATRGFGGVGGGSIPFGSSYGVAEAAAGAEAARLAELGLASGFAAPNGLDAMRFGSLYDPYALVPPGSRRLSSRGF